MRMIQVGYKSATTQVPETIGGSISHEAIVEDMREDGLLPAELPEWKNDVSPPPNPPFIQPTLELTEHAGVSFEAEADGSAHLCVSRYGWRENELPPFTDIEARKAEVLTALLTDVEEALPVLRTMVRNLEETAG